MAQDGDTITYTFSGAKETEDISDIDRIAIDRMDGADGGDLDADGGSGGYIESSTVDVSSYDTLEIWVGESGSDNSTLGGWGRSDGGEGDGFGRGGGGSTELWVDSTTTFIAGADAGGGGASSLDGAGGGGARGGSGGFTNSPFSSISGKNADGSGFGGDGSGAGSDGEDGGQELGIASGGTTTTGGSSAGDGEIIINYVQTESPPSFNEVTASPIGESDINQTVTLSIDVSDAQGDTFDVVFRDAFDNSQIGSTQSISSSGTATVEWSGREYGVDHSWFVEATDSTGTTTSSEFTFSITPPNANVPEFAGLGKRKGQRFSDTTVNKTDGVNAMKVFRATGNGNSFPQDFTEIDEISGSSISEFEDNNAPVGNVEYAFAPKLSDGSLGGESVVSTFTPDEDGAFISPE